MTHGFATADSQGGLDMPSNAQDNALQNEDPSDFLDDMVQDVWDKATDVSSFMSFISVDHIAETLSAY